MRSATKLQDEVGKCKQPKRQGGFGLEEEGVSARRPGDG